MEDEIRTCSKGHPKTPENQTKNGRCRLCRRVREREQRKPSGNTANKEKTHCPKGHRLAGDNLLIYENGGSRRRFCRACHREASRKYYHQKVKPIKHPRSKPGPKRKYY